MRIGERAAPVAATLSALATLACCLPLGIAGAVGALGLGVALQRFRPWLIGLALVLLAMGCWQLWRSGRTCRRRSRISMVMLGVSGVVVIAVMLFPQIVAGFLADHLP